MAPVFHPSQPYKVVDDSPKFDPAQPYEEETPRFDPSKPYVEDKRPAKRTAVDDEALQSLSLVPFGMAAIQAEKNQELIAKGGIVLKSDDEIVQQRINKASLTREEAEALGLPGWVGPLESGVVSGLGGLTHPDNVLYAALPTGVAKATFNTMMAVSTVKGTAGAIKSLAEGKTDEALHQIGEAGVGAAFLGHQAVSGRTSKSDFKLDKKPLPNIEQQILTDLTMHGAPETAKVMAEMRKQEAPVPERPETVNAQLQMMEQGKRPAILVTPGESMPVVDPAKYDLTETKAGTFVTPKGSVTPEALHEAVAQDRIGDVLGYGIPNKPPIGEEIGVVTVRDANGVEKHAVVTDQANLQSVTEAAHKVVGEGDTVALEPAEKVIEGRKVEDYKGELVETVVKAEEFNKPPPKEPELVGMGGAIPAEFSKPDTFVSNMFAAIDKDRAEMGKPPMAETVRRSWDEDNNKALSRMNQDPEWIPDLIAEVTKTPRALQSWENAGVVWQRAKWKAEANNSYERINRAFEDKRMEDLTAARIDAARFEEKLDALDKAVGRNGTGSEAGRSLNAQKMAAGEDFTLVEMRLQRRASKGGKPLTPEEESQIAAEHKKIEQTQKEYEDYLADNDKRLSEQASKEVHAQIVKEAAPQFGADVIRIAKGIVERWDKEADAARKSMRERLGRTSAGLDPTILLDLAKIGRSYFGHAALDFTQFSAKMVGEFGDLVNPHIQDIYDASKKLIAKEEGKQSHGVKKALKKTMGSAEKQAATTEAIKEKLTGGDKDISHLVQRLARAFVEQGIKERNALIDAVHGVLKTIEPEITRRDTMDAISGYGDFKPLSKDQISVQLRDLKGQMQQVAKLEDMQGGKAPSKTGVERRLPSDEERRLVQQVNEAKRKGGFTVTDPAQQLKSALDSVKTRMKHQIADFEHQIATGTKIVREKSKLPLDAEANTLKARRDALKADYEKIFGSRELTDAQKLKLAQGSVERSIAEYERRIKEKDFSKRESTGPTSPELEAIKARRDALREEYETLKDLVDGKAKRTPEEIATQAYKTRIANETARLQDKLARGDFSVKPKRTLDISKDMDAMRLKADYEKAKKDYLRGNELERLGNRTAGQKAWDYTKEAFNLPRNVLSSWDLSAVLRQGGFIGFGNPVRAAKAIGPMLRGLASERAAHALEQQILSRPNAHLYSRAKLYLPALDEIRLSAKEEAIMSRLGDKIPGVKQSNRAFLVYLNKLRADSFDSMVENLAKDGKKPTDAELNAIANYINVATGRGELGRASGAAETLATFFFSPRLVASRFQLLAGQPMYRGTLRTRTLIATEYAKTLTGLAVVFGLGALAGGEIEDDMKSTDFGKIRFGNTRVDPMMGLAQNTVLVTRLLTGEKTNANGKTEDIRGDKAKYGAMTGAALLGQYFRTKLNPVMGKVVDVVDGKNVVGEKVTVANTVTDLTIPLSFRDVYAVMREHGVAAGTAMELLSLFGAGVQHYDNRKKTHVKKESPKK